jgi:hypothetical protein
LIGISVGNIEWLYAIEYALSMIIAAWGLSRYNSLIINTIGLIFFVSIGVHSVYSPYTKTIRTGPWKLSVYFGIALILIGLFAYTYDIIKLKGKQKLKHNL